MRLGQPESTAEAIHQLVAADGEAKVIAGGTAVVLMMQQRLIAPEVLVSLGNIPDFAGIRVHDAGITIGAGTTLRHIAASEPIRDRYPSLATACRQVGNIRIRNAATIGGNLAEADYASDPPAVLVALEAMVRIAGPDGDRVSSVDELVLGFYATTLEPAEIITAIDLPPRHPSRDRDAYLKYISRSSEDRPCVGVAASARFEEDEPETVSSLRVAIGAATGAPRRFPEVEAMAGHRALDEDLMNEIAGAYSARIDPIDDLRGSAWYRRRMVHTFTRQALRAIARPGPARASG
ncbi:MAG: FAD binding domain-containing protein [Chloroflexota bacterium]|nr:FAD binding domain-containing protein [Chloroflexota bacterium]